MKEYTATARIDASSDAVWSILTDAAGYKDWNPEIIAIAGVLAPGNRITVRVRLGSGALRSVPMRVNAFEPPLRMEWTGGGLPFGLFTGRRTFTIAPAERGVDFRLHLTMSGPLSNWIIKSVGDRQPEVESFVNALKARAENR